MGGLGPTVGTDTLTTRTSPGLGSPHPAASLSKPTFTPPAAWPSPTRRPCSISSWHYSPPYVFIGNA